MYKDKWTQKQMLPDVIFHGFVFLGWQKNCLPLPLWLCSEITSDEFMSGPSCLKRLPWGPGNLFIPGEVYWVRCWQVRNTHPLEAGLCSPDQSVSLWFVLLQSRKPQGQLHSRTRITYIDRHSVTGISMYEGSSLCAFSPRPQWLPVSLKNSCTFVLFYYSKQLKDTAV